jgi:hypothetical protein
MSKRTYRIKIKDGHFIDNLYESPVDEYQVRLRRNILLLVAGVAAICIIWYLISR